MKKSFLILLGLTLTVFSACKKDKNGESSMITDQALKGVVQKGPFLNGSSISAYELNEAYSLTGKNYTTQITDNSGLFQINNISLISPYLLLKADGYFFNEVGGTNSSSPIILYALADITNKPSININILSNLEKGRIDYLLAHGNSFSMAKKQAEKEVLKIFSISKPDIAESELLNISQDGDDNAILLAISVITEGFRTEADLSEMLANISTDISTDGELNSDTLGSLLINDARLFDLAKIRTNIENRYASLGMTVTVPNFEKYVRIFLDSSKYQITNQIVYPEFSNYGENILFGEKTIFTSNMSLAAELPKGASLKIVIKNGMWYYRNDPCGPVNWTISEYNYGLQQQTFTVTESGKSCDVFILFNPGTHVIEYYENNSVTPTRIKTILI